jgi:hypothetical protein
LPKVDLQRAKHIELGARREEPVASLNRPGANVNLANLDRRSW